VSVYGQYEEAVGVYQVCDHGKECRTPPAVGIPARRITVVCWSMAGPMVEPLYTPGPTMAQDPSDLGTTSGAPEIPSSRALLDIFHHFQLSL
jgi:hypothetical protein